jgi:chemotaxis protein MotB
MVIKSLKSIFVIFLVLFFAGCSFIIQKGRRSDVQKIEELSQKVDELSQAQRILEDRLSQEIKDKQVKLKMAEKGLVITFVADVLFDSGKAKLKADTFSSLDKVARVLNENVADLKVGVEGHTDNEPIKFSGWKSNWELSTERALSVLHYLVDHEKVSADRLSVLGYGEYQPVSENNTKAGKKLNRRVEVVIFPKLTKMNPAQEKEDDIRENEIPAQEKIK